MLVQRRTIGLNKNEIKYGSPTLTYLCMSISTSSIIQPMFIVCFFMMSDTICHVYLSCRYVNLHAAVAVSVLYYMREKYPRRIASSFLL